MTLFQQLIPSSSLLLYLGNLFFIYIVTVAQIVLIVLSFYKDKIWVGQFFLIRPSEGSRCQYNICLYNFFDCTSSTLNGNSASHIKFYTPNFKKLSCLAFYLLYNSLGQSYQTIYSQHQKNFPKNIKKILKKLIKCTKNL